ncbi:CUB and zona pellucida-like domain-containing protein 1 [Haliotis rubra]|uniref:CUB and zona pellucida-like domain-containing protein 1 n=1 Tax=Haliotis rubra TaxID=36100 RepID=UPI001EE586D9|nr:CUB and zona pellucida-like domain-containing protein 1 [Haliotis rubra]
MLGRSATDYTRTWNICGKRDYTYLLLTRSTTLITFSSQGNPAEPASFRIEYTTSDFKACQRDDLVADSFEGEIISPGYPYLYPDRTQCVWQVMANQSSDLVMINIQELDLHSKPACGDSVAIYDGPASDFIKTPDMLLCDNMTDVFNSTGRYATIKFSTNDGGIGKGFKIRYKSVPKKGTGDTVLWSVSSLAGVIIIIVILVTRVVLKRRRSDRTNQTPSTETSDDPHPHTSDQAAPFSPSDTTNTTNTSSSINTTNSSTSTNNTNSTTGTYTNEPPPAYEDVYNLPVTDPKAPSMLPPSYKDAVSRGMILNNSN